MISRVARYQKSERARRAAPRRSRVGIARSRCIGITRVRTHVRPARAGFARAPILRGASDGNGTAAKPHTHARFNRAASLPFCASKSPYARADDGTAVSQIGEHRIKQRGTAKNKAGSR